MFCNASRLQEKERGLDRFNRFRQILVLLILKIGLSVIFDL